MRNAMLLQQGQHGRGLGGAAAARPHSSAQWAVHRATSRPALRRQRISVASSAAGPSAGGSGAGGSASNVPSRLDDASGSGGAGGATAAAAALPPPQQQQRSGAQKRSSQPLIKEFGFRTNFAELYELGPLIGSGSFGTVHVAIDRRTRERFAVKTLPKRFLGEYLEPTFAARVRHEADVYAAMGQSLNVAHLEAAFEDDVAVDLVLELCAGGSMWARIRRGAYGERAAARLVREVLRAVAQCHAKGVVIRDVKPDNFLFLNEREGSPLKMIDFGLAQFCSPGDPPLRDRAGTPFFVAPEVLKQSYSLPADVWSAGITAYQLLTGRFPWHADPEVAEAAEREAEADAGRTGRAGGGATRMSNKLLFRAILSAEFDFESDPWPSLSPEAKDCVKAMLTRDPAARPTAAELLRHPWLASLDGSGNDGSGSSNSTAAAAGAAAGGEAAAAAAAADAVEAALADTIVQRLQRYGTYGRLKQVALREVAHLILADDGGAALEGLRAAFSKLDPQGTGRVPFDVAAAELRDGGYDLSEPEIRHLLLQFDLDRDGFINLDEWSAALMDWGAAEQRAEWAGWVRRVYELFDGDHDGVIDADELAAVLCGGGLGGDSEDELCVPDAVPAALRRVDADGDGRVSFEEFAAYLHTSDAEALDLFPSRRLAKGAKRTALSVAEQRRRASSPAPAGGE